MVKPSVRVPVCPPGAVTTTFHAPVAAPRIGQLPEERALELVNVKPVHDMVLCPTIVRLTVTPDTKELPVTEVIEAEPLFTPLVGLIAVTVGAGSVTVKPLVRIPFCPFGLVTTTFHAPAAAPLIGQLPEDRVFEFVNVNPEQTIVLCPAITRFTVASDAKLVPVIDVMDADPMFAALLGLMAVTVGTGDMNDAVSTMSVFIVTLAGLFAPV